MARAAPCWHVREHQGALGHHRPEEPHQRLRSVYLYQEVQEVLKKDISTQKIQHFEKCQQSGFFFRFRVFFMNRFSPGP